MLRTAVDERRHPRIIAAHHRFPEGRPGHPLIVNASQGGACLWLGAPPTESQRLMLHFASDGCDRVLPSRIVWSRPCAATTSPTYLKRAVGWLAGIAFTQPQSGAAAEDIPHDLLRDGHVTVSFERGPTRSSEQQDEAPAHPADVQGMIALDDKSVHGIKEATRDLMPLFAKHFSDVRVTLKQQHLEITASFRDPASSAAPKNDAPQKQREDAAQSLAAPAAGISQDPGISQNPGISQDHGSTRSDGTSFKDSRRRALIAISGIAVVAVVAGYKGIWRGRNNAREPVGTSGPQVDAPAWAPAISAARTNDWIEVQSAFGLSDATVRKLIELLQHNEIYPPAHDLYDLAKYPREVRRAFYLVGNEENAKAGFPELGKLKNDLESRLIAGARFPDEPPGGRYSSLQRELYNNVVVLGVIDLLYRQREDPAVKQLLAAIASAGDSGAKPVTRPPTSNRTIGSK